MPIKKFLNKEQKYEKRMVIVKVCFPLSSLMFPDAQPCRDSSGG